MKKKSLMAFTMLSLVVVLTATSVSAQSNHNLVVTIPFEFAIRGKTLPPGEYIVKRVSSDRPEVLSIGSVDVGTTGVAVLTSNIRAKTTQRQSTLVFNQYGSQYFLSQIWEAGDSTGRKVMKSRKERQLERELAKNRAGREKVAIVGFHN
jgi:hypothetical protein